MWDQGEHGQTFKLGIGSGCSWSCHQHSQNQPFLQRPAYRVTSHHSGMLTCANSVGQNSDVSPTYSCETTLLFIFYKGLNICYSGQNLIPVLQQWTIMTWRWFGFAFCCGKSHGQRAVMFPWGSQRKNQILLKIPRRMIATFTFYCSNPQQKNIWNSFNHISSHTKAIKSTLQIIYDSTQCNIIHNTILIILEKNGIPQPIRFFWPVCNKDWISFYPALVSMRLEQKHIKLVGGRKQSS